MGKALLAAMPKMAVMAPGGGAGGADEPLPARLDVVRTLPPLADMVALAEALKLVPEAKTALDEIAVPGDFSVVYDGPVRSREQPKDSARRFAVWMQATGQAGVYASAALMRRYAEFCDVDHREPCPENFLLGALAATPGVHKDKPRDEDGKRPFRWTIFPGKVGRAAAGGKIAKHLTRAARRKLRKARRRVKEEKAKPRGGTRGS